jgi:hypothetical protein
MSKINVNYLEPLPTPLANTKKHHSNNENLLSQKSSDLAESGSENGTQRKRRSSGSPIGTTSLMNK